MSDCFSRREVVTVAGGAVVAGTLPVHAEQDRDPCDRAAELGADVETERGRVDSAEADLESATARIDELRGRIEDARTAVRGEHPYPESMRRRALDVGLAIRPSVAVLDVYTTFTSGTATGWFVDDDLVLTNAHNVADASPESTLSGWTLAGDRFEFEVVDYVESQNPDVALLRTDDVDHETLPIGESGTLSVDDPLVQIGHPGGFDYWVVSLGAVLEPSGGDLVTSVPGLKGVSGSPIVDLDGRVVGMTYGGEPVGEQSIGGRPEPGPTTVHQYPFVTEEQSLHVPIERAIEKLEAWT